MPRDDAQLEDLVDRIGAALLARGARLAVAESCTGGWLAKLLTDRPGSSAWFDGGLVTYSNAVKIGLLGVPASVLEQSGAVSAEVAGAMAAGARAATGAGFAVAITGIAGPDGGSEDKPVGTVCFAWSGPGEVVQSRREHFSGDRRAVRRASVEMALAGLAEVLGAA